MIANHYPGGLSTALDAIGGFDPVVRQQWYEQLVGRHPAAIKVLTAFGLYGEEAETKWPRVWRHSLSAAVAGNVIARALRLESGDLVENALMIHDCSKRRDKEARPEGMSDYKTGAWTAEREYGGGRVLLGEFGIPEKVERLSHANILRGFSLDALGEITRQSDEEKIIHYVDCIFTTDKISDPKLRLLLVELNPEFWGFSDWFKPRYSNLGIGEVQLIVAGLTAAEFEKRLNLRSGTLHLWIKYQLDLGPNADIDFGEFAN